MTTTITKDRRQLSVVCCPSTDRWPLRQRPEIAHRPARGERRGRGDNCVGIDAVVPVEVRDGAGLAEMLDAERTRAMSVHGAEPRESRGMSVEHGDDAAVGRNLSEQFFDMRARVNEAALTCPLSGGLPGIEPTRRSDSEKAHVAA